MRRGTQIWKTEPVEENRETFAPRPMSLEELLALDNVCPAEDTRPFGKVTASSRSFWLDSPKHEGVVELAQSSLLEGAFELTTAATIHYGLPVRDLLKGETIAVTERRRRHLWLHSSVQRGFPVAYHPKIAATVSRQSGRLAGGGKMWLSEDPHVTIINGESREFVYPDAFPYSAVCKLHIESQKNPGGPWGDRSHATGFLVGSRTLMTSGHAHPDTSAVQWRIQVIPACWAGRSIFGSGYVTYVRTARWWHSDGGNDFMISRTLRSDRR